MRLVIVLGLLVVVGATCACGEHVWPEVWTDYAAAFMDDQTRVIDHDAGERTTSEGQAYAMFFALVADDQPRFERLVGWTERNLASGDLSARLPAWLWGRGSDETWGVLDPNSAADADVWMAYSLLEAGALWSNPRYTALGTALANRILTSETLTLPETGMVLLPGANGFRHEDAVRLNVSYMPIPLFIRIGNMVHAGAWLQMAARVPLLVERSSPNGFPTDWLDVTAEGEFRPSPVSSYDAIRVYLWAGMMDRETPGRSDLLKTIYGPVDRLRDHGTPPARVSATGQVVDARGPIGFSAALLPFLSALGERQLMTGQLERLRKAADQHTHLYGSPARYYDQNLALFGIGAVEREFWFDAAGKLHTRKHP